MKKYKDILKNKKENNQKDRLEILPDGENWRWYFDNYVLTDNEYIVYYNINNIIYLYNRVIDINTIIGDLDDLNPPIDNTSIVNAINYIWENGGGEVETINTDKVVATEPDLEGGATQEIINENNKESIDNLNNLIDLTGLEDPIPQTSISDAINFVYDSGGSGGASTTDKVDTIDPDAENGTTQQEVNQNNKTAIDNLNDEITDINTEIDNIIDGTTPITFEIDTSNVNTIDSDLENGATQQEVNQNNKTAIDAINSDIDNINNEITEINDNLPDLTNYYTKAEVDSLISDLQTQINNCCGISPTAIINNVITTDTTSIGGADGSIIFDTTIANFIGVGTATLTPIAGTTAITLNDGDNIGLTFTNLVADTYTITILDDSNIITSQNDIIINDPSTGGDLIPLTPEEDDDNNKTDGVINDNYNNYDIIISKNQHPDYVANGLFIGKEIAIDDINQSGIIDENELDQLTFTSLTEFDAILTGEYTGIYYLKGLNIGLTPLITKGQYENGDTFTFLEDITNYNFIIQKWYDNSRENFTYTLWEVDASVDNDRVYTSKNAAETATNGWHYNNQKIETGIGEPSYLEIIYGFNFTEITDIVTSSTSNTFTISDFSTYDFLSFNIKASDTYATWLLNVNDIVQDGITKHSYANYNQDYFTIIDNVITWFTEGGLGHFELNNVKGIKI